MKRTLLLSAALVTLALALNLTVLHKGGGSALRGQLVSQCVAGDSSRASCICTVDTATAQGVSLATLQHTMTAVQANQLGISGVDRRILAAGLECEGR